MKEELEKIRELLNKIEQVDQNDKADSVKETFDYFELPQIVKDIVDYLQPELSPYEMAVYWYMFRHSVIETADVYLRVSLTKLAQGIGTKYKSADRKNNIASDRSVSGNVRGLEEKGIIKKVGDANREGTIYQILLPEEIEICKERMKQDQVTSLPLIDPKKELDYYNVKGNRLKIFERDKYLCYKCGKQLTRFSATLDHLTPVSVGGDNSYDNLVTCCMHCNSSRRATPVSDFMET